VQHVFPNASQLLIVSIGLSIGAAVLTESVYSFLGVGFQDPTPSWGVMVADGRSFITSKPHLFFFPAGALMITVLAFMFVAEGIRDAFDPKLR
jgi:oligopeptide transport system permease protein